MRNARIASLIFSATFVALILLVSPLYINEHLSVGVHVAFAQTWGEWAGEFLMSIINFIPNIMLAFAWMLLALTGGLFDSALSYTVINFADSFKLFSDGITIAWAGFRDVANIVMIAMFVYLSFNVLLGIESYGLKKFGTKILIVALLINFSLFFTKAVVDVSNIMATSFYSSIKISDSSTTNPSISTAFINAAGLSGSLFSGEKSTLRKLQANKENTSPIYNTFLFVFLAGILSIGFSAIFVYGMVLLVTRFVTLILLMLTSSLAFVAMMTPGLEGWWDKWKKALLQNALFAPFFIIMLWATLNIMQGMGVQNTNQSYLANILLDKNGGSGFIQVLIIMGLLYASTKIASELSTFGSKIAKKAGMGVFSHGFTKPLASGVSGGIGMLGRRTLGHLGRNTADSTALKERALTGGFVGRNVARMQLTMGKGLAKSTFDVRNTKTVKGAQKNTGVSFGTPVLSYDKKVASEGEVLKSAIEAIQTRTKNTETINTATEANKQENIPIPTENIPTAASAGSTSSTNEQIGEAGARIAAGTNRAFNRAPISKTELLDQYRSGAGHFGKTLPKRRVADDLSKKPLPKRQQKEDSKKELKIAKKRVQQERKDRKNAAKGHATMQNRIISAAYKNMNTTSEQKTNAKISDLEKAIEKLSEKDD